MSENNKVTTEAIQQLRQKTGVGMMDCKKALIEAHGDIEEAITILRKKGIAVASKRADSTTDEGIVAGHVADNKGCVGQVSCETDFSARTNDMRNFLHHVLEAGIKHPHIAEVEHLMELHVEKAGLKLQLLLEELMAKIQENIKVARFKTFHGGPKSVVNVYTHPDNSVVSMVEIDADRELTVAEKETLQALARDICMQIAVTNPVAIDSSGISQDILARETDTLAETTKKHLQETNKPMAMLDKIVEGKLKKFFQDVCLIEQNFIRDETTTVKAKLEKAAKDLGTNLKVKQFVRFGMGR